MPLSRILQRASSCADVHSGVCGGGERSDKRTDMHDGICSDSHAGERTSALLGVLLSVAICCWVGLCVAVGLLYRSGASLASFDALPWVQQWLVVLAGVVTSCACFAVTQPRLWHHVQRMRCLLRNAIHHPAHNASRHNAHNAVHHDTTTVSQHDARALAHISLCKTWQRAARHLRSIVMSCTSSCRALWLTFIIGWSWVPLTLHAAFGADLISQCREFAWEIMRRTAPSALTHASFTPLDVYPIAHYLYLPANGVSHSLPHDVSGISQNIIATALAQPSTYLTDQHNAFLTAAYGSACWLSQQLSGSLDLGIFALALAQYCFAAWCCAASAHRFLNMPWRASIYTAQLEQRPLQHSLQHSLQHLRHLPLQRLSWRAQSQTHHASSWRAQPSSTYSIVSRETPYAARAAILLFFLTCPLVLLSTISLTKSPLFAFAFLWWFGIAYELYDTRRNRISIRKHISRQYTSYQQISSAQTSRERTPGLATPSSYRMHQRINTRRSAYALAAASTLMLISAKYAIYIVLIQALLWIVLDRQRWRLYAATLLLPALLVHGAVSALIWQGSLIGGDPIESRGIMLQQIARVAKLNPTGISPSTRRALAPLFRLDAMAQAYQPYDADPVKSSGMQSKLVSYRWRTVTQRDMTRFTGAWWSVVTRKPLIATDAFMLESYGYVDPFDPPYVSMSYYIANANLTQQPALMPSNAWRLTWIGSSNAAARHTVAGFISAWQRTPLIGLATQANTYVLCCLLLIAAALRRQRWRFLAWQASLPLLMGVMILSPANNFERHMLPLVFVAGLLALWACRDSSYSAHNEISHTAHLSQAQQIPRQ